MNFERVNALSIPEYGICHTKKVGAGAGEKNGRFREPQNSDITPRKKNLTQAMISA
jgi:hypothetical protein